jgi:hypothetical protein
MSDATSDGAPRRRTRAGSPYQPRPWLAFCLLALFVACVIVVLHNVAALPVGGHGHPTTTVAPTTTTTVPRSDVTVEVANGTNHNGLARTYTQELTPFGWDVLNAINGPATQTTIVYYRGAYQWAAKEVQSDIKAPASSLKRLKKKDPLGATSDGGMDVIVLLGNNAAS